MNVQTTIRPISKGARGFTIVELMVVVAVIAAIAVTGLLAMSGGGEQRALNSATQNFSDALTEARARAIAQNRAVIVRVSEGLFGRGAGAARIDWFYSSSDLCADRLTAVAGSRVLVHQRQSGQLRRTTITRVSPSLTATPGVMELCFQPNGRVVDPALGRPMRPGDGSVFGGRALIEVSSVRCQGSTCSVGPLASVISIGYAGIVERMPPGYRIPRGG